MMMRDNLMMMEVMMRDDEKISIGRSGRTQPILRQTMRDVKKFESQTIRLPNFSSRWARL